MCNSSIGIKDTKMNLCWHKWIKTSFRMTIQHTTPCCKKVIGTDEATVVIKKCKKCGKANAWRCYDSGQNVKADIEWAERARKKEAEENMLCF